MTLHRPPSFPRSLLTSLVAALTVWAALLTWVPLSERPGLYVAPLLLGAVVLAATGATARWRGLPASVVTVLQVVVAGFLLLFLVTGSPWPTPDTWDELKSAMGGALTSADRYAPPIPADVSSVAPAFVLVGVSAMVLFDLVALTARRVALGAVVLLALHLVPANLGVDVAWPVFGAVAAGFLTLLFLDNDDLVVRWGSALPGDPVGATEVSGRPSSVVSAVRIGAVATAGAIVVVTVLNAAVPRSPVQPWRSVDDSPVEQVMLTSPLVDLRRDLDRGADVPLMRVKADRQPSYVRTAVLSAFDGQEWSTGGRSATRIQDVDGRDLPLRGIDASLRRVETEYDFTATPAFRSRWLPVLPLSTEVVAPGDWRYDVDTMDFAAFDADLNTSRMKWSATGVDLEYSSMRLDAASSGRDEVDALFTSLPASLPESVRRLTNEVTKDELTRFGKARALQSWFRSEFTYSLDRVETVDNNALVAFLDPSGRVGYCEQFAASMAVMARTLGIPARVAVGFLVPRRVGTSEWEFSSHDLHAWPELYFPGSGWVRFEPTPSTRASSVPEHSQQDERPEDEPSATASASASPTAPSPSASPEAEEAQPEAQERDGDGIGWSSLLGWLLVITGIGALSVVPQAIRTRRRSRRLESGAPEDLWEELRDSALDLGRAWPDGRSPRATGRTVLEWCAPQETPASSVDDDVARRMERIVVAVERSRFARPDTQTPPRDPSLASDVEACVETMAAQSDRSTRWKARWVPRSLTWRR